MNTEVRSAKFPSIFIRSLALWIDAIIVTIAVALLFFAGLLGSAGAFIVCRIQWDKRLISIPMDTLFLLIPFLIPVYFCFFNGLYGKTPGKAIMGIRVSDMAGRNPGILKAALRLFLSFISLMLCFIGFLWILFNRERRALHDILSRTIVVYERDLFLDSGGEIA